MAGEGEYLCLGDVRYNCQPTAHVPVEGAVTYRQFALLPVVSRRAPSLLDTAISRSARPCLEVFLRHVGWPVAEEGLEFIGCCVDDFLNGQGIERDPKVLLPNHASSLL